MDVETIPFDLVALVGEAELPMSAYLALRVGDILLLEQPVEAPLVLKVGKEPRFRGRPGLCETRKAVRIER